MKLLAELFVLLCSLSTQNPWQNYLQNPTFENNGKGWESSIRPEGEAAEFTMKAEDGELRFEIKNPVPAGYISIGQNPVKLPSGAEGRFTFELDAETGAYPCWFTLKCGDAFLHHQAARVEKGHNEYCFDFYTPSNGEKRVDVHVYWSIGCLKGRNVIRKPAVTAIPVDEFLPYQLPSVWHVQDGAQVADFSMVEPFVSKEKQTKVIFNSFSSERAGVTRMGLAVEGDCVVFVNGQKIRTFSNAKIRGRDLLSDQILHLPVKKGENEVKIEFSAKRFICGRPSGCIAFQNGKGYRYIDTTDLYIKPGTALDLSSMVDRRPCDEQGKPIINAADEYVFERSGKKARFYGDHDDSFANLYNLPWPEYQKAVRAYIESFQRQGYNYARLGLSSLISGDVQTPGGITEERLERTHFILSEFSRNGIFVNLLIAWPTMFGSKGEQSLNLPKIYATRLLMYLQEPETVKNWRTGAKYLNHVGKTTKTAIKDYPCVVAIECFNEQYAGLILLPAVRERYPEAYALFQKTWDSWLEEKYGNPLGNASIPKEAEMFCRDCNIILEKLVRNPNLWYIRELRKLGWTGNIAQDNQKKRSFKNTPIPNKGEKYYNDYCVFLEKLVRDLNEWYVRELRNLGWDGVVVQNNYKNLLFRSAAWTSMSGVNDHSYYEHPTMRMSRGSIVGRESSIKNAANYIREMASGRFNGRPFFIGEINHAYWNPYLYEFGPMLGAYAAHQGFSGFNCFCNNVLRTTVSGWGYLGSFGGGNPVSRGSGYLLAYLYGRGDVQPSNHHVQVSYPNSFLYQDGNAMQAPSSEQSKLMMLAHYSIAFPDLPIPKGVNPGRKADLSLAPGGLASITDHGWFASVNDTVDQLFSLEKAVAIMREKGILSQDNRTDVAAGVFESDTGEILMRTKQNQLVIRTPLSEVFVSPAGKSEKIGALTVRDSSVKSAIGLVSQDALPLKESHKMLLIYSTRAASEEMRLSEDEQTMIFPGLTKVLLQTGKLNAELENNSANLEMYALSLNGTRLERIPLEKKNEVWEISIDTEKIQKEPAVFFEIFDRE